MSVGLDAAAPKRKSALETIEGGLIVSCQPVVDGPMDRDEIVLAMALASQAGGAVAVRIEGWRRVAMVASQAKIPIIGIVKRELQNSPVRITPKCEDVMALADAGAWMIATDATHRPRPDSVQDLLQAIHARGCLAMADCASYNEGLAAHRMGFDCVGSTLSGYTGEHPIAADAPPDRDLVRHLSEQGVWVIAEGRIASDNTAAQALNWGAKAVTVGSALTRLELMVAKYVQHLRVATCEVPAPQSSADGRSRLGTQEHE